MDPLALSKEFLQQYYGTLMTNRKELIKFYTDASTMTYNGDVHVGRKQIEHKIESFGFQKIVYSLDTPDVQPGPIPGSLLIFVTGRLQMDDTDNFKFCQIFNICPNGQGGLYCHNDIFRTVE